MVELVHEFRAHVIGPDGRRFVARVYGAPHPTGPVWDGWLVFFPEDRGSAMVGDRETTQSNRVELGYWAGGIEPIYLEGALDRAVRAGPILDRHRAWGDRAGEIIEEEQIAYRLAHERLAASHAGHAGHEPL